MPFLSSMEVSALSHAGRVRSENQDAWSYSLPGGVFAVCDGIGGAAGGEVASRLAAEAFLESLAPLPHAERTGKAVMQAVCAANRRVHARAAHEPTLEGMGTTLVGLVLREEGSREAVLAHVGDSRAYRWRRGVLERLTEDHSVVAEQIRMGVITEDEAERSPMRHVITRSVGTRRSVAPELQVLELQEGDTLLLCSDGLTREIGEDAIAAVLRRREPLEARTGALVHSALRAGGRDNITAMLIALP